MGLQIVKEDFRSVVRTLGSVKDATWLNKRQLLDCMKREHAAALEQHPGEVALAEDIGEKKRLYEDMLYAKNRCDRLC
jgi:hypothetical protein